MPSQTNTPVSSGRSRAKSFSAKGRRLSAPPAQLVRALRELGDEESVSRLADSYARHEREKSS